MTERNLTNVAAEPRSVAVSFTGLAIGEAGSAARGERLSLSSTVMKIPDTTVDGVSTAELELRAAAVRGLSHRHWGTPRQDAYAFDVGQGWWTAAVADGLGSLKDSHVAAHAAAEAAVQSAGDALRADMVIDWDTILTNAREAMESALPRDESSDPSAPLSSVPPRRGASTLTVACGVKAAGGEWCLSVMSIGDSRCSVLSEGSWMCVADPAESDPDLPVSTATDALPDARASAVRTGEAALAPGDTVAVFTDGIGAPFGQGGGQVAAQLAEWWAQAPHSLAFAGQVGFMRHGFHDDRACVAVWLPENAARDAELRR